MSKTKETRRAPKRIVGVKIPKGLRYDLRRLAKDEQGREAISGVLQAAAAALATAQPAADPVTHKAAKRKAEAPPVPAPAVRKRGPLAPPANEPGA